MPYKAKKMSPYSNPTCKSGQQILSKMVRSRSSATSFEWKSINASMLYESRKSEFGKVQSWPQKIQEPTKSIEFAYKEWPYTGIIPTMKSSSIQRSLHCATQNLHLNFTNEPQILFCSFQVKDICTFQRFPTNMKEDLQLNKNGESVPYSRLSL